MLEQSKEKIILLKKDNFNQTQATAVGLSQESGKLGLRLPAGAKNKLAQNLDFFKILEVSLAGRSNNKTITSIKVVRNFSSLKRNSEKINQGYYLLELTDSLLTWGDPVRDVFDLLIKSLSIINKQKLNLFLSLVFSLKLLKLLGFLDQTKIKKSVLADYKRFKKLVKQELDRVLEKELNTWQFLE